MRLHELAKELKTTGKDVVEKLHELKQDVKNNPMTMLTPEQVDMARKAFEGLLAQAAAAVAAAAAGVSAPIPAPAVATPEAPPAPEPVAAPEKPAEPKPKPAAPPKPSEKKVVIVKVPLIVKDFAEQIGIKPNQLIATLMTMNIFASINERIELKVAQQVAEKRGFILEQEKKVEVKPPPPKPTVIVETEEDRPEDLIARPPIVTDRKSVV